MSRKKEIKGRNPTTLGELKGDVLWALESPMVRLGGLNTGKKSEIRKHNKRVVKGHARATHQNLKGAHRWTVQDNLMEAVGRFFSKSNAKQFTNNIFNSRPPSTICGSSGTKMLSFEGLLPTENQRDRISISKVHGGTITFPVVSSVRNYKKNGQKKEAMRQNRKELSDVTFVRGA